MTPAELLRKHDEYVSIGSHALYRKWLGALSFTETDALQKAIAERRRSGGSPFEEVSASAPAALPGKEG